MVILDQIETELPSAYSGSYNSVLTYGTFFDGRANNKIPIIADKINGVISSSINNQNYTFLMSEYAKITTGSFIGRSNRFINLFTDKEYIFDTLMSHPLNYSSINGANPVIFNTPISGSKLFGIPPTKLSSSVFLVLGTNNSIVSSSSGVKISDNTWLYSFPFQSRYKSIKRYFSTNHISPEPIKTVVSWSSNMAVQDMTFTASINRIASIDFVTRSFSNANNPNAQTWTVDYEVASGTLVSDGGIVNSIFTINNFYFGIGIGKDKIPNKGYFEQHFPGALSIDLKFISAPILRGYKYGVYNANKVQTNAIYRNNSFGNFRDMLEQRKNTKLFNKSSNSISDAVVKISFVSGTSAFKNAKDYITASMPSYNPNDSGIFDYEYKSGKPFSD